MLKRFFWLAFLPLLLPACDNSRSIEGSGTVVEDQRTLEDFSAIEVEGNYTIVLTKGPAGLVIETDDNLLPYIQTEVKRGTLRLSSTESIEGSDGTTIRISYPELDKLEIGGAASVTNEGTLEGRNLDIIVKGAAMVDLNLDVRKIDLDLDGASSVELNGTAKQLEADLNGAGNLAAYDLRVRDAAVTVSGIGGAQVFVTDNLQAEVSGVGGITYKGKPQNIQQQVTGIGSVEPAGADEAQ